MSVEHSFPSATIPIQTPLGVDIAHPDAVVWRSPQGPSGGRNFVEYGIHTIAARLGSHSASDEIIRALSWWDRHCGGVANSFWLHDPVSREHLNAICGPRRADGTQTAFIIPVEAAGTVNALLVAGQWQDPSTYTITAAPSLIISDAAANGSGGSTTGLSIDGDTASIASVNYVARMGDTAIKVTPDGTNDASSHAKSTNFFTVSPTTTYSFGGSILAGGSDTSFRVSILWYTAGDVYISNSDIALTGVPGSWVDVYDTVTSPGTAAKAIFYWTKLDQTVDIFFVGAGWMYLGDCSDKPSPFLPSYHPQMVVFTAAPAAKTRLTGDLTGERYWYGMRSKDVLGYQIVNEGVQVLSQFQLIETVPL